MPQTSAGYEPTGKLGHQAVSRLRNQYQHTAVFIMDEVGCSPTTMLFPLPCFQVSMCGNNLYHLVNQRLNQLFGVVDRRVIFDGLVALFFGDFGQCPPVGQPKLFLTLKNKLVTRHLFNQAVVMMELTELKRHANDMPFAQLCKNVRMGKRISRELATRQKYTHDEYENLDGYTDADIVMLRCAAALINTTYIQVSHVQKPQHPRHR
jgi:hypothetical protein